MLLTDDEGNILLHRNFDLPEEVDSLAPWVISPANEKYLRGKLASLEKRANVIHIIISPDNLQHLYYDDSKLLRRLSYYPYVQLAVMLAFIAIVYFAVNSTRKAEQNKVWVGLSKETAHQLGTPISSLMAWTELLRSTGTDEDMVKEMDKDINRLSMIASRFSKIGSRPNMEREDLNQVVARATGYMQTRISSRINLTTNLSSQLLPVDMSAPPVRMGDGEPDQERRGRHGGFGGHHCLHLHRQQPRLCDSDRHRQGNSAQNHKTVFNPGFTTKKRGWGLGLALAKRIVEQYHRGRIYVSWSEPSRGTTFRIELPLQS